MNGLFSFVLLWTATIYEPEKLLPSLIFNIIQQCFNHLSMIDLMKRGQLRMPPYVIFLYAKVGRENGIINK